MMKTSMYGFTIDTAAMYSFKYLNSGLTVKENMLDAHLNIARFYMSQNQFDSAWVSWSYLIKETKNAYAAEAKYNMAYIYYSRKEYNTSKKVIFEIAEKYSNYAKWYEKSFLLLADLYHQQKDNFQAKATLQSLIENLDEGEHKSKATERLKQIIAEEESNKPKPTAAPEKEIEKL